MKRSPLKRKTPLRRRKPMVRWRRKADRRNSYARRERDLDRMLWIKTLPCALRLIATTPCDGAVEADHIGDIGNRAMGRKSADDTCIPLCTWHHTERTLRRGFFAGMSTPDLRAWADDQIAIYRGLYDLHGKDAA